jgi:hypothetical protein
MTRALTVAAIIVLCGITQGSVLQLDASPRAGRVNRT